MGIITFLLLFLILILLLLLYIPIDLEVHAGSGERSRIRLGYLFGWVHLEIREEEKEAKTKEKEGKPKKKKLKKKDKGGFSIRMVPRDRAFWRNLLAMFMDMLRSFKITSLRASLRYGLSDPAETGYLFALLGPVAAWRKELDIRPDFDEEVLEGQLEGAIRFQPYRIILPVMRFAFSWPTMVAVKNVVVVKWKG